MSSLYSKFQLSSFKTEVKGKEAREVDTALESLMEGSAFFNIQKNVHLLINSLLLNRLLTCKKY